MRTTPSLHLAFQLIVIWGRRSIICSHGKPFCSVCLLLVVAARLFVEQICWTVLVSEVCLLVASKGTWCPPLAWRSDTGYRRLENDEISQRDCRKQLNCCLFFVNYLRNARFRFCLNKVRFSCARRCYEKEKEQKRIERNYCSVCYSVVGGTTKTHCLTYILDLNVTTFLVFLSFFMTQRFDWNYFMVSYTSQRP